MLYLKIENILVILMTFISVASFGQHDGWNISTSNAENYTGIVVANGRLGILPSEKPLEVEQVILNNVFDKESPLGVSRILLGMNFGNLEIEIDGEKISKMNISDWKQTLN